MHFADGSPMMNSHCVPSTTNSLHNENAHVGQLTYQQDASRHEFVIENLVSLSPSDSAHEHSCESYPTLIASIGVNSLIIAVKNSNEIATCAQALQPYQGRNPCMERNLMSRTNSYEELSHNGNILVDKSSKHMSNEQPFRAESHSLISHDYLSQHALRPATPIPYVQNVITENSSSSSHKLKQTNVHELLTPSSPRKNRFSGWSQLKRMLASKKSHAYVKCHMEREDSKSNLLTQKNMKIVDTNVTLGAGGKYVNGIVDSAEEMMGGARPSTLSLKNRNSDNNLSRQESLDKFNQVFNVGTNALKDPNMRIKTPGDLPPSVRKVRGRSQSNARFSLYDDRIMCNIVSDDQRSGGKSISTSVPFGMDLEALTSPKVAASDVTCF